MARVLHIEDDDRNRLLVRKLLSAEGIEVTDAADGLEGVRLAMANPPDLVLVDLNIPGLDGYEVTLRLRSESAIGNTPIIAITAEGNRDTSYAVGCDGFIQKPIDPRAFAQTVRRFLSGHRDEQFGDEEATGQRLREQSHRMVVHLEQKIAELSQANARLLEIERLRREFYRNISHELATPLTPIVGYLRMLIDQELGPLTKPQERSLRATDDCVTRLRATLDNLVDVTALETGSIRFKSRPFEFVAVVEDAIRSSSQLFERGKLLLRTELPSGSLAAVGDCDRLKRAIIQLLDNAAKFTPEGGQVGIRVRENGARYEVLVADTGPGVPVEQLERIFDPFYQIDGSPTRAHGGVGIGLAIARKVARGLGGDLSVGAGATVSGEYLSGAAFLLTIAKRVE